MNGVARKNIGIGYKVFNPDWTCRGFQYEVGQEYVYDGEIEWCKRGFHFCPTLIDCFNYYTWDSNNRVAIIHYDTTKSIFPDGEDKIVTSHIRIEKEIAWDDVMRMCNVGVFNTGHRNTGDRNTGHRNTGHWNTGHWNTGDRNTGDQNTGDWNTGDRNTGHWNTGDRNIGDRNTGDRNTGDRNTGHWNTGHWNTGDRNTGHGNTGHGNTGHWNTGHRNTGHRNTGDRNTGDWNTGDRNTGDQNTGHWNTGHRNTGHFNSITPDDILVFNLPCRKSDWEKCDKPDFIYFDCVQLVFESDMTDEEKMLYPHSATTGGYLKVLSYQEAFQKSYSETSEEDRAKIKNLPNFDAVVFFEISGIQVP